MTTDLRAPGRVAAVAVATLALALAASPAGADSAFTSAFFDPGMAPGQVEHGTYSATITGTPAPLSERIEYWISNTRWRTQATDTRTGRLAGGALHDGSDTWTLVRLGRSWRVQHTSGRPPVPVPGYTAPFNRLLLQGGVQLPRRTVTETLRPLGAQTVAGLSGTRYEELFNGSPETSPSAVRSTLTIEDGTYRPLARVLRADNGRHGRFVQSEVLTSRSYSTLTATRALSARTFKAVLARWRSR